MDTKIKMNAADAELRAAFAPSAKGPVRDSNTASDGDEINSNRKHIHKPKRKWRKSELIMLIVGIIGIIGGVGCILCAMLQPAIELSELNFPDIPSNKVSDATYSTLTGEILADADEKDAPMYCVQTPNGTDGARPQAGLNTAGVVFEAVAEAGITRFAAIYQNPSTAIIGPIRSLRLYYLQWDAPFDCTIVHAGGADDALAAIRSGGYKDLSEDYSYMYRGTYGSRLWNNLFITSAALERFSTEHNYNSAKAKGFTRMTPEESEQSRAESLAVEKLNIIKPAKGDTSELGNIVSSIALRFGGLANFNVNYKYDADTNRYLRSYESGAAHEVYNCEAEGLGENNPEDVCKLTQMSPSVVIAMVVSESRASDNYHENITTVGSGDAYIFQNGTAMRGRWNKPSVADQIKFTDADGNEVRLAPGQTFISAVPSYGSVNY